MEKSKYASKSDVGLVEMAVQERITHKLNTVGHSIVL